MRYRSGIILAFVSLWAVPEIRAKDCSVTSTGLVPINDLGTGLYLGRFVGGLYPDGSNQVPAMHAEAGLAAARNVTPLNVDGQPDPDGKYVMISVGMSNTTQEFCGGCGGDCCAEGTFIDRARSDPRVNDTSLVILDGARGGQTADTWDSPGDANYDRIRDEILIPRGLSEAQVQVVWVKVANAGPQTSLPDQNADAYRLVRQMGNIARALQVRYPNVQLVFFSSRIYAGYADTSLNPEPFAYESGFAVKWVIEAQIDQMAGGGIDSLAGDLDYSDGTAPWLAWSAYLWADGLLPRSDGFIWECDDFANDGTHPSASGRSKVGALLMEFFTASPFSTPWFLADGGAIPCADIRKFSARCRDGTLSARVVMTDHTHDGRTVTIDVDGMPYERPIIDGRAKLRLRGQFGTPTVTLSDPPGCFPPRTVSCN